MKDEKNEKTEQTDGYQAIHLEVNRDEIKSPIPKEIGAHDWVQQGPYLVCRSCPLRHTTYIGVNKRYFGKDEKGLPILRPIEDSPNCPESI